MRGYYYVGWVGQGSLGSILNEKRYRTYYGTKKDFDFVALIWTILGPLQTTTKNLKKCPESMTISISHPTFCMKPFEGFVLLSLMIWNAVQEFVGLRNHMGRQYEIPKRFHTKHCIPRTDCHWLWNLFNVFEVVSAEPNMVQRSATKSEPF